MRYLAVLTAALITIAPLSAVAEIEDVTVGGSIRIRGNWFSENAFFLDGTTFTFSDGAPDALFLEQRTRVNVEAALSDGVSAFVELDTYNNWGDDNFRRLDAADAAYSGTVDRISPTSSSVGGSPVSLYQAYVDVEEVFGTHVGVRVGRQEITVGSEFLVGNNDTGALFTGNSFDGISLRSQWGDFQFRSWYTQLALNNNPARWENSGDVWYNGVNIGYVGFEGMSIEAYSMRYHQALTDPMVSAGFSDNITFFTFGARFAGERGGFDWDGDIAYQIGDSGFSAPNNDISALGGTAVVGYTFKREYQPRIFINGTYLDGDDQDQAFFRLFSDHEYSHILGTQRLTNVWIVGGGVGAQITESIGLTAAANYYNAVEDFGAPDSDIGFEVSLVATYQYSDELGFSAGYARFFAGDGLQAGLRVTQNGRETLGGLGSASDEDLNYVWLETSITF